MDAFDPFASEEGNNFDPFGVVLTAEEKDTKSHFSELNVSTNSNDISFSPDFIGHSGEKEQKEIKRAASDELEISYSKSNQSSYSFDFFGPTQYDAKYVDMRADNTDKSTILGSLKEEIPVTVAIHEDMSCIYDVPSKSTSISIYGTINVKPLPKLLGVNFYLTLKDPDNHLRDLTSCFDCITEKSRVNSNDKYVMLQRKQGHHVFRIDIPEKKKKCKLVKAINYTCSKSLRPVPILVQTKARIEGKFCLVNVKLRSNPLNAVNIRNVVLLLAVPPDVNGDTMKMSRKDGMWDAMKRIVVWSEPEMKSGKTFFVQLQFEFFTFESGKNEENYPDNIPPKFPIFVRCDGIMDQLSTIGVDIGSSNDEILSSRIKVIVFKSYRLYHRNS